MQIQIKQYPMQNGHLIHQKIEPPQLKTQEQTSKGNLTRQKEEKFFQRQLIQLNEQKKESPLKKDFDSNGENSIGQMATELANARNRLDVQLVISKATQKLSSLRMRAMRAEGKERTRLQMQIKRIEKLLKRTRLKMRNIGKEEHMEQKCKEAAKQERFQEADRLEKELRGKRRRRVKEEADYAIRERAKDTQVNTNISMMPENTISTAMETDIADAVSSQSIFPTAIVDVTV